MNTRQHCESCGAYRPLLEYATSMLCGECRAAAKACDQIDALRAQVADLTAFCVCGCPVADHEDHGEEGEGCEREDHVCLRASAAVVSHAMGLQHRIAALTSGRDELCDQVAALTRERAALLRRHTKYCDGIAEAIGLRKTRAGTCEPAQSDRAEILALRAERDELQLLVTGVAVAFCDAEMPAYARQVAIRACRERAKR